MVKELKKVLSKALDADQANRLQLLADDNRQENLQFFTSRIESAITSAKQNTICSTLLLVCLNDFIKARQTLGNSLANRLLEDISDFLKAAINKPYAACRLTENEFGILLFDVGSRDGIALAEFISSRLDIALKNTAAGTADIHASIGIATINTHARNAQDIIHRARINTDSMSSQCLANREADVREALEKEDIALLYQPMLPLRQSIHESGYQGGPGSFEVFLRLRGQQGTMLLPEEFLPQACMNKQASAIDKAMLKRIFTSESWPGDHSRRLFVPITSHSMACPDLPGWLKSSLEMAGAKAEMLVFLIGEIDLQRNQEAVLPFCLCLDKLGIRTAISGFGRALDPLPVLEKIQPFCVQLENALVRNILHSHRQQAFTRELVNAIHGQATKVAVTGIQDIALLPLLWDLGVDYVQGDFLHAPAPSMDFSFPCEQLISTTAIKSRTG